MPLIDRMQPQPAQETARVAGVARSETARPVAAAPPVRRAPSYWATWAMLSMFIFICFECALLAAALKGSWFILLAPSAVCGVKALDSWRALQRAADA